MCSSMATKNIIAFVSGIPAETIKSIRAYEKTVGETYRIMLIENSQRNRGRTQRDYPGLDILLEVDLTNSDAIARALMPYQNELVAITSRNESFMADFIAVIPNVPYLKTPSTESLVWAVDKLHMRRRFKIYDKKITPKYTRVKENTDAERERIIKKIGFPMIVKPANLAQSMLVTICYHEEELAKTLKFTFANIERVYAENGRVEKPRVIAEEYMEGIMYSVDAYVSARGKVYFCPLVRIKTGKDIGHQDFYGYLQMTPAKLTPETIRRVEEVAAKGVHALGLRSTTVHVELLRIDEEWKVIEIGARIGGFRHRLHALSCDINHSMNDVLIRMGKKPVIPKRCTKSAAAMKWFPKEEGVITKIAGIKKVKELESFVSMTTHLKRGDVARFAKNGGLSVFNLILANKDRSKLLADIRRVEELVVLTTEPLKNGKIK